MLMVLVRVSMDDSPGAYLGAHLVVFLVIPNGNRDFRMAPLWRENPRTPKELASELATIMEATELVTDWNRRKLKVANYEYLGPHCCRIGDKVSGNPIDRVPSVAACSRSLLFAFWPLQVFRCYDNRFGFTERRPNVYLEADGVIEGVENWIHIKDSAKPMELGDWIGVNPDWLWKFRGQTMVLSSPYIKGTHYATKVSQLLGVINHLEQLHKRGYVHGDIRAFNIIFTEESGYLIDFDIGGLEDENSTMYPRGYNQTLNDAFRAWGEGDRITKQHDWQALIYVLLELHDIKPPVCSTSCVETTNLETLREEFLQLRETERLLRKERDLVSFFQGAYSSINVEMLKDFLNEIAHWDVEPSVRLRIDLSKTGSYHVGHETRLRKEARQEALLLNLELWARR
jgi:Fungal protein kinase